MRNLVGFVLLFMLLAAPIIVSSYGRSGDLADPSFLTTGNEAIAFSVEVDTASAVLVYDSSNSGYWDREILLQNTSTDYDIYCGTASTTLAGSGPRFLLPKNPAGFTSQVHTDFYCVLEESAGSNTVDVVGVIEFCTKD